MGVWPHRSWVVLPGRRPAPRKRGKVVAGSNPPEPHSLWPTSWTFPAFSVLFSAYILDLVIWSSVQCNLHCAPQPCLHTWIRVKACDTVCCHGCPTLPEVRGNSSIVTGSGRLFSDWELRGILDFLTWNYFQPSSCRDSRHEHTCLVQLCGSGKIEIALIHHLHTWGLYFFLFTS